MKNHLFHVLENGKGIRQEYNMIKTDSEMSAYLKAMRENYGYIPGLGGDKNYNIVAWYEREDNGQWPAPEVTRAKGENCERSWN